MKQKSLILLICLTLMAFVFSSAAAEDLETVTTITLKTGALLSDYTEVSQILDIAAIRIHSMPEGYGAFVLSLNNTDALTSMFRAEQDGIYAQINALGEQPLYFTWEEIKNFITEQMEAAYSEMSAMDMDMPFNMSVMKSMMDGSLTDEQLNEMMDVDDEMLAYISDIEAKQVIEIGSFALNGSDTADTKTVIVLEKEDLSRIFDLPAVREQAIEQALSSNPEYTEEEIVEMVDAELAEVKEWIEDNNVTVTMAIYTMYDEFIAMSFAFSADVADGSATTPVSALVTITRTTIDTAKFYQLSVVLKDGSDEFLNQYGSLYISDEFVSGQYTFYAAPDEPMLQAVLNCDRSVADTTVGELALTVYDGEEQTVYIMFDQTKADNVTDTAIDVYTGSGVDNIKAALTETSLISVNLHTVVQADSGFFSALQSATPETSVQLLQMSEEELESYMQDMEQGLLMTLMNVIENLPPEISNSLMQGMGGF